MTSKDKTSVIEFLKENLSIEVDDGDFTDPNRRTIKLFLGKEEISRASFDVVQKREYEG